MDTTQHSQNHISAEFHHHHSHGAGSLHCGGHHLLQIEGLTVSFKMYKETDSGLRGYLNAKKHTVQVVHNLNLSVHVGEVVAVVGASGSGKTLMADSIMGIFEPNAEICGTIWFDGKPQTANSLAALRGNGISLVPQSVDSLDPLMRIGRQVRGVAHGSASRANKAQRAQLQKRLFKRYKLASEVEQMYPYQLSGGMARRVLLCCALMEEPSLIVADEPTPGLDLDLAVRAMDDFREFADAGGGVLLITHDIELALRVADRIAVFKDGTIVEETPSANFRSEELLQHEFTRELWRALPEHGFKVSSGKIEGEENA
ncbi:ATP-binding cassette domain-containing protein [Adlercreutzia sp. ZJ304]|uniref:ATP-binding cassette domain-containing protein n=1 Tax=Adlercreutzia sp. ZJ304 TaxID=2709791 RepID=UPI0013E9C5DD|nr:ATP-binding cassette domain-containing protein [Adlercreutzia sp. ZJ304]